MSYYTRRRFKVVTDCEKCHGSAVEMFMGEPKICRCCMLENDNWCLKKNSR